MLVEAIDLLVGGRASADLVRTGEDHATDPSHLRRPIDGRDSHRAPRDLRAGPQPRVHRRRARHGRGAARLRRIASLSLHGQHEHQSLLDPAEHVDLLDAFARPCGAASRMSRGSASTTGARPPTRSQRTQLSDREKRARIEIAIVPVAGNRHGRAARRRRRRPRRRAAACWRTPTGSAASRPKPTPRCTKASRRADPTGRASGSAWRISRRSTPARSRTSMQRDDIKPRLEDLAFFLRDYRDAARRVARSLAGGRGSAGRDRAGEASLRTVARRRPGTAGRACGRNSPTWAPATSARRDWPGAERDTREAFATSRPALSAARAKAAHALARRARSAISPNSRCRRAASRCACSASRRRRSAGPARHRRRRVLLLAESRARMSGPLARIASGGELSRFMLALRLLTMRDASGRTLDLRRSGCRHRRRGGRRGRRAASGARPRTSRCSASRTWRRLPRARTRTSRSASTCAPAARTRPS